ncbi:hypothetical protein DMB91_01340 [Campylobacter sp. MIT 97-5078]|nr:hypothetical protein DMB91_01340 [Campylobacter sp. MIT 97-5078]
MKRSFLAFIVLITCVFASDELNIDNLFKKQIGLRSITSFSFSINADTAISVSADFGGSSAAPDSVFGLSLWRKF